MQTDPSRWLVALAGFSYDWIITREWKRVLLTLIPVFLALGLVGVVFWGSRSNSRKLATWYLELGNEEIAGWEDSWAPETANSDSREADGSETGSNDTSAATTTADSPAPLDDAAEDAGAKTDSKIPAFASTLFRKVQLLEPGDQSQYVIGVTLAQQGAISQAEKILTKIAPHTGSGYAPAHMVLTELYWPRLQSDPKQYRPLVLHHLMEATRWNRMPNIWLFRGYKLLSDENRNAEALGLLAKAAERDPAQNLVLAQEAQRLSNEKLAERAMKTAERYFQPRLEATPSDDEARLGLAQVYLRTRRTEQAEKLLFEAGVERTPRLARAQSTYFLAKFRQTAVKNKDGQGQFQMAYLEKALRLDPTNTEVPQEVARLAAQGAQVTDDLIEALQSILASGQATAVTELFLAEAYLGRGDLAKAIPHLERYNLMAPNQPLPLNNLAFCLAEVAPERMQEALELSEQAVRAARAVKQPKPDFYITVADIYDTYSHLLSKLDRPSEAIAAIQTAIELVPDNVAFRKRAIELFRSVSDDGMVEAHTTILARLEAKSK